DALGGAGSERLRGLYVTPEFFEVFGVRLTGRSFLTADRGGRTIVLGHDVWLRHFGADASLVGGTVALNARNFNQVGSTPHVVLAVAATPVRFPPLTADFQLGLATVEDEIAFWTPQFVSPTSPRDGHELDVVAKLRSGITVAQAQAEMDAIALKQAEQYPESSRGWRVRVVPLREQIAGTSRTGLLLLTLGTWMFLFIACAD